MWFSFTERGAGKLIRNGYQYVKEKDLANGLTSWECIECRKGSWLVKVKLNGINDFLEQVKKHTHAPSGTRCELTKVRVKGKHQLQMTSLSKSLALS